MSFKTDRLTALFPDAYAASDTGSLLYTVLDAVGAEFMHADESLKALLKSHWVRYAPGDALERLAAGFGVTRATMRDGTPETDDAFRTRLMAVVPMFTGGGTVQAVKGAVRAAIGLPFDLSTLGITDDALLGDIENVVALREFSPEIHRITGVASGVVNGALEVVLNVALPSVGNSLPRIVWTMAADAARRISVERVDTHQGVRSLDAFLVPPAGVLVLTANARGELSALLNNADVTASFVNLDGSPNPKLPEVGSAPGDWKFRAYGATYDLSVFDAGEAFDAPSGFAVELSRLRLQPLTFDVEVPYFVADAVDALRRSRGYAGDILVYQGLPLDKVQGVIDQTKAAGVEGHIQFSLRFAEDQDPRDASTRIAGLRRDAERQDASESFLLANVQAAVERQEQNEHFALGGVFDISTFDKSFGFQ
ncbi:MAG TPA: hypothetical protein VFF00_10825 [Candidatus Elarobacter sp.]|nr:hypothetical protein [Candidatus Elarobacter sp.]